MQTIIVSPLEQFEIVPLSVRNFFFNFYFDFTLTNSFIYLIVVGGFLFPLLYRLTLGLGKIIPNSYQLLIENIYTFINQSILENSKGRGKQFVPFVFSLFMTILALNLLGMVPYSFTITSHLVTTLTLSLMVFVSINLIMFRLHGWASFSIFLPAGAPIALAPFLVVIELISYLFRGLSLAIRLFANMMAGHTLLKVIAGFGYQMFSSKSIFLNANSIFPFVIVFLLTGMELGIAVLQAYVFTILTCIYLNDALNLH